MCSDWLINIKTVGFKEVHVICMHRPTMLGAVTQGSCFWELAMQR